MARPLIGFGSGCALHGALVAAAAIPGVAPLVHSTPGCALRGAAAATQTPRDGGATLALSPIASTNLAEKHIVFGGASRLREEIKNALSILPHGLLVVLTGCATEMIGDDAPAMVREVTSQGEPVIEVAVAGFLGSARRGYEQLLAALAARDLPLPPPDAARGLVNLFGVVPRYDETWVAELDEISRLLAGVGLVANPIFGPTGGVGSLAALPRAAASLALSPWGLAPAEALRAACGVPVVVAQGLPVGADAIETLLDRLAEATGLVDLAAKQRLVAAERTYEDFALEETLEALTRLGRRRFGLAGGSLVAGSLASFLVGTLGWEAATVVATDEPPGGADGVVATADAFETTTTLRAAGADFLIGGAREVALARERGALSLQIADLGGRAALNGGFSGARGAGRLLAGLAASLV